MAEQTNTHPPPQVQLVRKKIFSLVPAIFTSFSALSEEPQPTVRVERISRLLQSLNAQHAAVKRNMMGLLQARRNILVTEAKEKLARLEGAGEDDMDHVVRGKEDEMKRSRQEMLRRMRVKMIEGAKAEQYEARPEDFADFTPASTPSSEREGTNLTPARIPNFEKRSTNLIPARIAYQIRQTLALDFRNLVDRGTAELEAYDNHAAELTSVCKKAFERQNVRHKPLPLTSGDHR